MVTSSTKPLRADAERNRLAILQSARELFAVRGFEVALDDIAAHAGVGVGTLYRRFANREEIVNAIVEAHFVDVREHMAAAVQREDAWPALVDVMEFMLSAMIRDRSAMASIECAFEESETVLEVQREVQGHFIELCERAQAAGDLRPDASVTDFMAVFVMIRAVIDYSEPAVPGTWRRYFELVLDGLATGERRTLSVAALDEETAYAAKRLSRARRLED